MNHHMPAGVPGAPHQVAPALPLSQHVHQHAHQQSRREYGGYHQHHSQSPVPHNIYNSYPHQYYGQVPTPPFRWQSPYAQHNYMHMPHMQQQQQPPQHHQYQPRSPMVVSSQPHPVPLAMTPVARQQSHMAPPSQSPRPIPPYFHQQAPASSPSPNPAPIPAALAKVNEPPQQVDTSSPIEPVRRQSIPQNPLSLPPEHKQPFWPNLPWYSDPENRSAFPARATPRRRRRRNLRGPNESVALPTRDESMPEENSGQAESQATSAEEVASETSTIAAPSEPETPATSQAPSESDFTQVSTPLTPVHAPASSPKPTPTQQQPRKDTRTAVAVPNLAGLPKSKEASPPATQKQEPAAQVDDNMPTQMREQLLASMLDEKALAEQDIPQPTGKATPKSWADLVRPIAKPQTLSSIANGEVAANGFQLPKGASLADALKQYNVQGDHTLSFLEPRGLVNTGNMCYMNSILQILVFCTPFFNFLDQVRRRTVHSMKSDTPLVDAMIMFMREFKVLGRAESVGTLRSMLKQEQLEVYGEPITPEYVYDVIRQLPRFAGMRRGHQQDAEEFLGFLLEGLHDECVKVIQGQPKEQENGMTSPSAAKSPTTADGWHEVGPKQKAAITRTAGQQEAPSPITKIFGGHLRSELRVPGLIDSVTLEPYKPLQLDIGAENVNNIVDALKGLTRTEVLTGEFGGRDSTAKKQVFIEKLPPVLILHLKRFQYDNSFSGTQKIWKKVGYPLELEIPKEVFQQHKRGSLALKGGLPKYCLTSVVYHHGKSAAGGHYTVDVLRQDSREWVRMDDTMIRRIRPEDVAEGGAEEDPKLLAKALEQHKADQDMHKQRNMYQGLDEADRDSGDERPWSEVNGQPNGHAKKWSGAAIAATNGTETPNSTAGKRTPTAAARKESVRDNKVAYILLYERMRD